MGLVRAQFFGDVSGKVGGVVFSRNHKQKILRSYVYLNQAATPAQATQRAKFRDAKQAWNGLDGTDRQAWFAYAKLYNFRFGAYAFFIQCYLTDFDPMPSPPYSYYKLISITPAEYVNIDVVPIVLVPDPGPGKVLIPRSLQVFCDAYYFEGQSQVILLNGFSVFPYLNNLPQNAPLYCMFFPEVFNSVGFTYPFVNNSIILSDISHGIDDGGSADVKILTEYSIVNWPF